VYYHDPSLAHRLEVLAHWRLTPKQISELSDDEISTLNISYRLYERRWLESLSDLIGGLTGTSWSVDALTAEPVNTDLEDFKFTWKKRPDRARVSLPLTVVVGGNKILEHVKKVASDIKAKERHDPSILSLPSSNLLHDAEVVDLSKVPKEEFIKFAKGINNGR
jgi:hypothetical protein